MTSSIGKNEFVNDRKINFNSHESPNQTTSAEITQTDLLSFVGLLSDSPSFNGDPVEIQRKMRDEWL